MILEAENVEQPPEQFSEDDFEMFEEDFDYEGEIKDAIFKLRAHSEPLMESAGAADYSIGFEAGLEMAAGILENLLRRAEGENDE